MTSSEIIAIITAAAAALVSVINAWKAGQRHDELTTKLNQIDQNTK